MKFSSAVVALATVSLVSAGPSSPQCVCCKALAKLPGFKDKVWTPEDGRYDERLSEYYSANAAQAPWCMVFPESTEDVSALTKVLSKKGCPFGMRSGAHSAWKGSNGIKDGVTVDFGHLNSTTYDETTGIASIRPGSTWGPVYNALSEYNVIAVGGRADVVGVGGFTTGGGYSFHTGVRGFACDNVVNFEVVLGDGSIINANADKNSDLWKVLKGGSGNFGFVTRIDQEVYPDSIIYASLNSYTFDKRPALRQAYYDFVFNWDNEPESQMIVSLSYTGGEWGTGAIPSNIKAEVSPVFDPFFEVEARTSIPVTGPGHEVVPVFTGPTPLGLFATWQTGMINHSLEILTAVDEIFYESVQKIIDIAPEDSVEVILQWQPVTQGVVDIMNSRGGNILGLDAVVADGPACMYTIVSTVSTAETQDIVLPMILQLNADVMAKAEEIGQNKHWEFLNYAYGDQDPLSHYGAENIALMKAVSQKYDAGQVFQKLRRTGFHIPQ